MRHLNNRFERHSPPNKRPAVSLKKQPLNNHWIPAETRAERVVLWTNFFHPTPEKKPSQGDSRLGSCRCERKFSLLARHAAGQAQPSGLPRSAIGDRIGTAKRRKTRSLKERCRRCTLRSFISRQCSWTYCFPIERAEGGGKG